MCFLSIVERKIIRFAFIDFRSTKLPLVITLCSEIFHNAKNSIRSGKTKKLADISPSFCRIFTITNIRCKRGLMSASQEKHYRI